MKILREVGHILFDGAMPLFDLRLEEGEVESREEETSKEEKDAAHVEGSIEV